MTSPTPQDPADGGVPHPEQDSGGRFENTTPAPPVPVEPVVETPTVENKDVQSAAAVELPAGEQPAAAKLAAEKLEAPVKSEAPVAEPVAQPPANPDRSSHALRGSFHRVRACPHYSWRIIDLRVARAGWLRAAHPVF